MAGMNDGLKFWGQGLLRHARENGWTRDTEKRFVHTTGLELVRESAGWRINNPRKVVLRAELKLKHFQHLERAIAAAKRLLP